MQKLSDGTVLYHGSYCVVSEPDLSKCAAEKDFVQSLSFTGSEKIWIQER